MTSKAYTSGNFELVIDGHKSSAYLKNVDGGFVNTALMDEPIGPENARVKHTSVASIEPFSVEFGLSGANDVLKWIQSSWQKDYSRRSGSINHANFDLYQTYEHEFSDALITETTFPALDGSSKDAAYIKVKFQPERVSTKTLSGAGNQLDIKAGSKQKMWLCSGFRFKIDGVANVEYTNKVESFTIKQGVKAFYTGQDRFPQIEPTKIEFPNIVGHIAQGYGDGFQKWYDTYVATGMSDPKAQKTGSLEFLAPDKSKVLFRINLFEVGLLSYKINPSTANADEIKRAKFELYVGRMELDGAGVLGLS
jgi:hypothetical protein